MNSTLHNGLRVLMQLAESPASHGVSELAEALDLPKSHAHRLLQTLVENRYVEQDASRRYRIGIGALRLGHALLRDVPIRRVALPTLQKLARSTGWAASLAMPFGDEAICVAYASPDGGVRPVAETLGAVLVPHASASGKLLLAWRPEAEREEVLGRLGFASRGPRTHPNADALRRDLVRIAARGYALNDRENGPDSVSLAVAVRDAAGTPIAVLGVAHHAATPPPAAELDALVERLHEAARAIEALSASSDPPTPSPMPAPIRRRSPRLLATTTTTTKYDPS